MKYGLAFAVLWGVIHCTGDRAGAKDLVRSEERSVEKSVKADIILTSRINNTTDVTRFATVILSGQEIVVDGDAVIDGKTFRYGIKGSKLSKGDPGRNNVDLELKPGAIRVVVARYRFTLKEVKRAEGDVTRLATQWVGTLIGFSVLHEWPDPIDDANSGVPQSIPPIE